MIISSNKKPLVAFRCRVGEAPRDEMRYFQVWAINILDDIILYSVQLISGEWKHGLSMSVKGFCDRTQMDVVEAS